MSLELWGAHKENIRATGLPCGEKTEGNVASGRPRVGMVQEDLAAVVMGVVVVPVLKEKAVSSPWRLTWRQRKVVSRWGWFLAHSVEWVDRGHTH